MTKTFDQTSISLKGFYLLSFFGLGSLFPLLGVYFKEEVGLSGTEIGTLMSIGPVVMIFAQPLWGIVTDYTRRPRSVLVFSLVLTAAFGYSIYLLESYIWLIALLIVFSFMQSALVPVSDSILLNYVQKENKQYGNYRLFGAIGFAIAVYMAGRLAEAFGTRVIFYMFIAVLILCVLFVFKMPKENQSLKTDLKKGIDQLIKMPSFLVFLSATFLVFGPIFANNFYFGFYIQEAGGTLAGVGLAFLLAAGSEAPFMKFAGFTIKKWGMMHIMIFAAAISAARWTFYFFEPSFPVVLLTTVVQGFSVGLFIPAAMDYVRTNTPIEVRVTAVSLYTAVGNGLGSWFCTFVGGVIFDKFNIFYTYLFFGALSFIGLFMVFILSRMELQSSILIQRSI
ncbi:MFS transporter [Fictibacillus barbaricus]|uniref:MFS transporter n=1 Tax=Fictibacillus barbaricus TaxID=182136 RepID=A0ABS2ZKZ1_9BACL|nr:MFS transporter [Fictibacillus barbaricus]MBN3547279.1 MFS transporter [Fictibacillus barbaricus]GGB47794.1 putative transporter YwbF [Fictibacillus barbaricus]